MQSTSSKVLRVEFLRTRDERHADYAYHCDKGESGIWLMSIEDVEKARRDGVQVVITNPRQEPPYGCP